MAADDVAVTFPGLVFLGRQFVGEMIKAHPKRQTKIEPRQQTAFDIISVYATATLSGGFRSVKTLERAMVGAIRADGCQLHAQALAI